MLPECTKTRIFSVIFQIFTEHAPGPPNNGLAFGTLGQRWSREHKARDQRHKKKSEAKAKDSSIVNRPSRGQGQECSRPRTKDTSQVFSKKKSSEKIFRRSPEKNVLQKSFQVRYKLFTTQKIVLFSSRGQGNLRGLEVSRPRT